MLYKRLARTVTPIGRRGCRSMTSVRPSWGRGSRRRSIQPQHFIYARPSGDPGACPPSDGSGSPAARAGPARPPCRVTSNNAGEDFSSTRGPRMSTASTRASSSRPPSATRPTRSTGSSTTRLCCRSRSTPPTRTATPRSSSTPTTSSPAVRSRIHDIDRQRLHQARHPTHRRVHRYQLDDPVLSAIARIVHGADLDDERHDAPEAHGLDVLLRGLSMVRSDRGARAQRPASGPLGSRSGQINPSPDERPRVSRCVEVGVGGDQQSGEGINHERRPSQRPPLVALGVGDQPRNE